ncbi:hypothetical protein [Porphyromonas canoris]|nr:hypothetical protein [Porphyromonas canoris]
MEREKGLRKRKSSYSISIFIQGRIRRKRIKEEKEGSSYVS